MLHCCTSDFKRRHKKTGDVMRDANHKCEQWIIDDIQRHRDALITPINSDPWVAISLLQKAIRRGDVAAQRAAHTHVNLRGSAVFRRFMVIAAEDIGAAPDAVFTNMAVSTDAHLRKHVVAASQSPYRSRV
jgi:replication-associated recombination protein RarA